LYEGKSDDPLNTTNLNKFEKVLGKLAVPKGPKYLPTKIDHDFCALPVRNFPPGSSTRKHVPKNVVMHQLIINFDPQTEEEAAWENSDTLQMDMDNWESGEHLAHRNLGLVCAVEREARFYIVLSLPSCLIRTTR
jgi:hypothetical protein